MSPSSELNYLSDENNLCTNFVSTFWVATESNSAIGVIKREQTHVRMATTFGFWW